jgi:flagellar hook-basal body complex protein FliE
VIEMADFSIQPFRPELPRPSGPQAPPSGAPGRARPEEAGGQPEISFRETIKNFIHDVDGMQKDSSRKIEDFMAGEISDVHDVMMTVEKAGTSFQLLMELRNKMLEAYQEIKGMSI